MGNFTSIATRATGNAVTAAQWNTEVTTNGNLGYFRQLAETVLSGTASSIDFTSIPGTFRHLLLVVYGRTDEAATSSTLLARFNNDSGANYDYQLDAGTGSTAQAVESQGQTSARIGSLPGASASANLFGVCDLRVLHYANSANNKAALSVYGLKWGTSSGQMIAANGAQFWRNNAAIDRITILPGSGNLVAGTVATLYGLPS